MKMRPWRRRGDAMASCREVHRVLQSYLDGQVDEFTAHRVAAHLDACRACGLEADVYRELKQALARRANHVDETVIERLREFGREIADHADDETGPASG